MLKENRLQRNLILLFNAHLLPLFFRLFTQVHLLIDGSVKGQCITIDDPNILKMLKENRLQRNLILLFNAHLLLLFFLLFTQVHLLIDGSVKGQYITIDDLNILKMLKKIDYKEISG